MGKFGISILVFLLISLLVFQPLFTLTDISAASVSAKITSFRLESTTLKPDDRLYVYVDVQNTGSEDHRFYVGFSIITPSGNVIDIPYRSLSLDPNETDDVRFDWRIPRDAQSGSYIAIVAVWEDESGGLLQNRLDDQRKSFSVEGFRIDADISSLSIGSSSYKPGDRIEVRVDVRNTGNTDHRFYVGFSIRDPNGRIIDISPNSLSLDPSETDYTSFSWYIPQDASSGSYEAIVAVWEDKSGSEMINRLADQRRTFTVEGFRIDADISSLNIGSNAYKPGDRVEVRVDVRNTGNTDHRFYVGFSIRDPNGNWIDIPSNSLSLGNGKTGDTNFRWTVPKDAPSGSYEVVMAVWEGKSGKDLLNRLAEKRTSFTVEGFRIDADISSLNIGSSSYKLGDKVEVRVDVRNTGNTNHYFYVGFSIRDPHGKIIDISPKSLSLDTSETDYTNFSWYIPKDAPSGTYEVITAVWQDKNGNEMLNRLADQRKTFTVEGFIIDADISSLQIDKSSFKPGDRVDVRVDVRNTGNTDHKFYVGFSIIGPSGNVIDVSPKSLLLDPSETDYTNFSWYIPKDTANGEYEAVVAIWEDKSGNDMINRLADQRRTFTVEGFRIDADISSLNIGSNAYKPGDRVEVRVDVRNTGNTDHRFYVGFSIRDPNGRIIDISPNSLSLDPSETDYTSFSWYIPQDASSGSYEAIVAVWEDKSGSEMINRVTDQRKSFTVGVNPPVVIPETIRGEITSFSVKPGQYQQGERVSASVGVRDKSEPSQELVVGFSIRDPNGRWHDLQPQFTRSVDEQKHFDWVIPPDAPPGCYLARAAVYEGQANNDLVGRLDYKEIPCAFEVGETKVVDKLELYEISLTVKDLPSSIPVTVWIDNAQSVQISGGETLSFTFPTNTIHTLSAEKTVYDGNSIRYYLDTNSIDVSSSANYAFSYKPQYRLYASVPSDVSNGKTILSYDGWYDEYSTIDLHPPQYSGYVFSGWFVDLQTRNDVPLRLVMDRPHVVLAHYRVPEIPTTPSDTILYVNLEKSGDGIEVKYVPVGDKAERLSDLLQQSQQKFVASGSELVVETLQSPGTYVGIGAGVACATVPPTVPYVGSAPKIAACGTFYGLTAYSAFTVANQISNNVQYLARSGDEFTLILEGDPNDPLVQKAMADLSSRIGDLELNGVEGALLVTGAKMTWNKGGKTILDVPSVLKESLEEGRVKSSGILVPNEVIQEVAQKTNPLKVGDVIRNDLTQNVGFTKLTNLVRETVQKGEKVDMAKATVLYAKSYIEQRYPASEGYQVFRNVKLTDTAGRSVGEIDLVVMKDGYAVKVFEVKSGTSSSEAGAQIKRTVDFLKSTGSYEGSSIKLAKASFDLKQSQFLRLTDKDVLTIGPNDARPNIYDITLDLPSRAFVNVLEK